MTNNHCVSSPPFSCSTSQPSLWEASIRSNIRNETSAASFGMLFLPSLLPPCVQQRRALKELVDILDMAIEIADEGAEMRAQQRQRRSRSRQPPQQNLSHQDRQTQP
ncbi:hypothetical protein IV203_013837 [Nitzschia inconspicua]|uniref:Uncharacterized protein n=1 Tax=Nitzschia inconspicua TaxID=303405 RepID=A0A9K3Q7R5_9STRA|nr:hypothetical protein IV203_014204 [Nitzschia inconspicua]KAG7374742.1 hypothetical protein IV203_013837 [Nitzschia inconspicua]